MNSAITLEAESLDRTQAIGRALGAVLRVGDVIGLIGPLGAGKTALTKGIAAGAGVEDPRRVTSPTFVIVNEYDGAVHIYHIDAYRLGSAAELDALGLDEFIESGAIIVEWADRVADALPAERLTITIEPVGEQERTLRLHGLSERAATLIQAASVA